MRYLKLLVLAIFFIGSMDIACNTGVSAVESVFLPREYYVGDKVELRLKLNVIDGFLLRFPEKLPESSWIDFHSVEISGEKDAQEVRILFTSFIPGTRSLPVLQMGDIILDSVKIHTSSLITSSDSGFIGIADQLLLPGTKLFLVFVISMLFLGPVIVLILWSPVRRKLVKLIEAGRVRRPIQKLNRILKELEDQKGRISCRRFYIRLSSEVRSYLSNRSNIDFVTLTTSDMRDKLKIIIDDIELSINISDMMLFADRIKFGRLTTDDTGKIRDIELVKKLSFFIENGIKNKTPGRGAV